MEQSCADIYHSKLNISSGLTFPQLNLPSVSTEKIKQVPIASSKYISRAFLFFATLQEATTQNVENKES